MERVILHCDANSFYASVECLYRPELRGRPVAVSGDAEARHGIILTKNQIAKRYGVKTGEAIWQAKQKCPDLVCVPPDFALYSRFSRRMRALYEEYATRVESFGLDECWVDLSNPDFTFNDGIRTAEEIRRRVREELGITVSVGVSFNKVFAKLGSDYKKQTLPPSSPEETSGRSYGRCRSGIFCLSALPHAGGLRRWVLPPSAISPAAILPCCSAGWAKTG